mgnify:CR=1 FL=1
MKTKNIMIRRGGTRKFTLVELMVAVSLMAFLTLFISTVFSMASRAMTETQDAVEAALVSGYAFSIMEKDFGAAFNCDPGNCFGNSGETYFGTFDPAYAQFGAVRVTYKADTDADSEGSLVIQRIVQHVDGTNLPDNLSDPMALAPGDCSSIEYLDKNLNSYVSGSGVPRFARITLNIDLDNDNSGDKLVTRTFTLTTGQ